MISRMLFSQTMSLVFILMALISTPVFSDTVGQSTNGEIIWIDCWFDIPDDLPTELTVECGQWRTQSNKKQSVLQNQSLANVETQTEFNLMFVVLRDSSIDHNHDPLFYLSGGPGSSTYLEKENIDSWYYWFEIAKLSRDIILVDQRGTGLSRPKFECANYAGVVRDTLKDNLPIKEEYQKGFETVDACLKKVKKKGFKLSDYSTSLSAADMNNIANALGYSEWNVMGGSYGTRLGLEWMRQNPTQIRSAILDSVYPVDKGALEQWPETVRNAFTYFWNQCASSTKCINQDGGSNNQPQTASAQQLEKNFWQAVAKLDENPQTLTVPLWYGDWPMKVVVNGHRFISLVYQSLYDDALQDDVLKAIRDINADRIIIKTKALKKLAENSVNSELAAEFNVLTYFAVECSETPIPNKINYFKELKRFPLFQGYAEDAYEYDPCHLVDKRTDLPVFRQPVESDIPALILSGGYDPVTPPVWARELSGRLKTSILWYLPDLGHGVVNSNACVHQSLRSFLDKPKSFSIPSC